MHLLSLVELDGWQHTALSFLVEDDGHEGG